MCGELNLKLGVQNRWGGMTEGITIALSRSMNTSVRKKLLKIGILILVCAIGLLMAYRSWDRRQMLLVTLEWGRLAPLPKSAHGLRIDRSGSFLSRGFRASFSAPPAEARTWLKYSRGTRNLLPQRPDPVTRRFLISPGGGSSAC